MKEGQVSPLLTALTLQKGRCSFYSQLGIVDFLSPRGVYFSRGALERSQVVSEQLRLTVHEAHTVVTYLPHHGQGACPALRTENPRLHEALGLAPGLIGATHGRVENGLRVCLNLSSQFLGTEGDLIRPGREMLDLEEEASAPHFGPNSLHVFGPVIQSLWASFPSSAKGGCECPPFRGLCLSHCDYSLNDLNDSFRETYGSWPESFHVLEESTLGESHSLGLIHFPSKNVKMEV